MDSFVVATAAADRLAYDRFRAANPGYPVTEGFNNQPGSVPREAMVKAGLITADNRFDARQLDRALCHVAIWRHCAISGGVVHVADERAVVRRDFPAAVAPHVAAADFDIVVWGVDLLEPAWIGFAPGVEGRLIFDQSRTLPDARMFQAGTTPPQRYRLLHCPNPCGYTISPAGARKLLRLCVPFGAALLPYFNDAGAAFPNTAFDRDMARHYKDMDAFILQPLLGVVVEPADGQMVTQHFLRAFEGLARQQGLRLFDPPAASA
jgi:hypothetical protein